jgi:hypothetical protein
MSALFIALGLLWLSGLVYSAFNIGRRLKFLYRDSPAAIRAGCRVCGAPASHASWHKRPSSRRWPMQTVTFGWCDAHYQAMRSPKPPAPA